MVFLVRTIVAGIVDNHQCVAWFVVFLRLVLFWPRISFLFESSSLFVGCLSLVPCLWVIWVLVCFYGFCGVWVWLFRSLYCSLVWFGLVCSLCWISFVRFSLVYCGSYWFVFGWFVWFSSVWFGFVWLFGESR